MNLQQKIAHHANQLGATVAVSSLAISLVISIYFELLPCTLCYWQRIFMYPLAFIYAAALWRRDTKTYLYTLPLAALGFGFSAFHYGLQRGWISLAEACVSGISCSTKLLEVAGFITIPLGALVGFLVVIVISVIQLRNQPAVLKQKLADQLKPVVIAVLAAIAISSIVIQSVL